MSIENYRPSCTANYYRNDMQTVMINGYPVSLRNSGMDYTLYPEIHRPSGYNNSIYAHYCKGKKCTQCLINDDNIYCFFHRQYPNKIIINNFNVVSEINYIENIDKILYKNIIDKHTFNFVLRNLHEDLFDYLNFFDLTMLAFCNKKILRYVKSYINKTYIIETFNLTVVVCEIENKKYMNYFIKN